MTNNEMPDPKSWGITRSLFLPFLLSILLFIATPTALLAQRPLDELSLSLDQRAKILSKHYIVSDPGMTAIPQLVFQNLVDTSIIASGPSLPYELTVISDESPNASSTAGGKVYVNRGLLPTIENDMGLWAAVLSHELAHAYRRHHYSAYLRAFQYELRRAALQTEADEGNRSAQWALLFNSFSGILNLKLSRDEEHDADRVGLHIMARGGYHPDFAISFQQRFRSRVGDQSKFTAFFSDHPRWATREERTMRYEEAIQIFEHLWPDPALSPGGLPPIVATLGKIDSEQDKKQGAAIISVPFTIRNAQNKKVTIWVVFEKKKKSVPSLLPKYQLKDGSLAAWKSIVPDDNKVSDTVSITVPSSALGTKDRKLDARIMIVENGELLDTSKKVTVKFPKLKKN